MSLPTVSSNSLSLLGSTTRVETPFIKVTFGDLDSGYTFGVYQKAGKNRQANGFYQIAPEVFPNYIRSLQVDKINGQVNEYQLSLIYPIRPGDDPNFFEKIFSSISQSRKIIFSYGDMSVPTYIYKNEEAIITKINSAFDLNGCSISYNISAISSAALAYSGNYTFNGYSSAQPSEIIASLIQNPYYGLTDLFYGMSGKSLPTLRSLGLLPSNDASVPIESKTNISILDYIRYLVSCMIPAGADINSNKQQTFYILTVHDDVLGENSDDAKVQALGGPYFQIDRVDKSVTYSDAYELIIGSPSKDIITNFSVTENENYSIYYNWQNKLTQSEYVARLNDKGQWEYEYAPVISSGNHEYKTTSSDKTWWSKITEYPIGASVTIKGLLRPAVLMQYVKLNILFFGKKHISSGTYIVTRQRDSVDSSGYRTTLELTRVSGESEDEYVS